MLDGVALGDKALKGRMAMLDNLSVVEVLPARMGVMSAQVYALAGIANALPKLVVNSQDSDGLAIKVRQWVVMI